MEGVSPSAFPSAGTGQEAKLHLGKERGTGTFGDLPLWSPALQAGPFLLLPRLEKWGPSSVPSAPQGCFSDFALLTSVQRVGAVCLPT